MTDRVHDLRTYLGRARKSVTTDTAAAIVIGNESADLDSMVSALLHGWATSARRGPDEPPAVPVINCVRGDFALRTEAVYLFSVAGVDVDSLLFIDEIGLERLHQAGRLRLTLVDHNTLSAGQSRYANAVEAIIDHHADAGLYPGANPRTIEPVGSASTLVADAILRERPELLDAGTATLPLGTILLDTVNLDPAAGRVTAMDEAVAARLTERMGTDPDELFSRLQSAKFDVASLGTFDLLRKDYKAWEAPSGRYGMSTVLMPLMDWIARDGEMIAGLEDFRRSQDLSFLVVMTACTDASGKFRRELAICAGDTELTRRLAKMLEAGDLALEAIRLPGGVDSGGARFFHQGNTSMSRKKLQPILHRLCADIPTKPVAWQGRKS